MRSMSCWCECGLGRHVRDDFQPATSVSIMSTVAPREDTEGPPADACVSEYTTLGGGPRQNEAASITKTVFGSDY